MKIIETTSDLTKIQKAAVLTIGNFDGLHIGHRKILSAARNIADKKNTKVVIMTFDPHPLVFLHPDKTPGILTPVPLKKHLLEALDIDCRLVIKTNAEILNLSPHDFVQQFLVDGVQPAVVVEGEDFNFGVNRSGSIKTLQSLGSDLGFEVVTVDAQKIDIPDGQTVRISSTMIRYMLKSGNVTDAAMALGRPYRLIGKVIPGRGKGKQLGYPTLNMQIPDQLIPAEAVYAGYVELADTFENACTSNEQIPAVFSIGQARTYGDDFPLLIEAHLLADNAQDLKGKFMAMDFIENIRTQHKFNTEKELANQIAKDCQQAKNILNQSPAR